MRALRWMTVALLMLASVYAAHAQGCSQCLDSTQSTPPSVQAAYRHAIYLLAGAACLLFVSALAIIRRNR